MLPFRPFYKDGTRSPWHHREDTGQARMSYFIDEELFGVTLFDSMALRDRQRRFVYAVVGQAVPVGEVVAREEDSPIRVKEPIFSSTMPKSLPRLVSLKDILATSRPLCS